MYQKYYQMKAKLILLFFLLISIYSINAQEKITWGTLSDVTFTDTYFPEAGGYFLKPNFGLSVVELEGKQVSITGFFIILDPSTGLYLISSKPMASCFFCGAAGPETVAQIVLKDDVKFQTDDIVTVTGTLRLNGEDINYCNYIIEEATVKGMK